MARPRAAAGRWRQVARRLYASEHHEGSKKSSSDLPWLIGSIVVTVPSATWLWQQGPKKSSHNDHHEHGEHGEKEEQEEASENSEEGDPDDNEQPKEEGGDESSEKGAQEGDSESAEKTDDKRPIGESVRNEPPNEITSTENKFTSGDEGLKEGSGDAVHKKSQQTKSVDPDADEGKRDEPSDDVDQGHEGEQKGTRLTEQDKNRKATDTRTNSMHPYMADERKSKKGEGIVETAKITGTVDTNRKLR